jgi:hypothetical protein
VATATQSGPPRYGQRNKQGIFVRQRSVQVPRSYPPPKVASPEIQPLLSSSAQYRANETVGIAATDLPMCSPTKTPLQRESHWDRDGPPKAQDSSISARELSVP